MTVSLRGKRAIIAWLVLIFAGFISIIAYWLNIPASTEQQAPVSTNNGTSRLSIQSSGQTRIEFRYENNHWLMVAPVVARANVARLGLLLRLRNQILNKAIPFEQADLDSDVSPAPPANISVGGEQFSLGAYTENRQYRHVRYQKKEYLIANPWFGDSDIKAEDFLDTRLLPEGSRIRELRLPDVRLSKKTNGAWQADPSQEVSTGASAALILNWQMAHAMSEEIGRKEFVGKPIVSIRFLRKTGDKATQTFYIIERAPKLRLYNAQSHITYVFPADIAIGLLDIQAINAEGETAMQPRIQ